MDKTLYLTAAILLGLTACATKRISYFPSYKLEVIQGNHPDSDAVAQLQTGMSREQVQHLLGTPLLRDPFHHNRWDYISHTTRNGKISNQYNLTLYFNNNRLVHIEEYDADKHSLQQQD